MEELRATFLEIYANLPATLRDDIVAVVDDRTYTWNSIYIEAVAETELGDQILTTLKEMGII